MSRARPGTARTSAASVSAAGAAVRRLSPRTVRALRSWYRRERRALPWRETREPYAIWVAETMLQQTRSETVLRYYEPFLRRFPTVRSLAAAAESAVLARWSGLGYYRRARALREAAIAIVRDHAGSIPSDPAVLQELPGVGRYTAGAVASIAFGARAALLDGNVARVLARLFEVDGPWRSAVLERRLWAIAEALVPEHAPGDWNQALMELGATLCGPREPACGRCPVASECGASQHGTVAEFPRPRPAVIMRAVRRAAVVFEHRGRLLLIQRRTGALLRGLWEFPAEDVPRGASPLEAAANIAARCGGGPPEAIGEAPLVHTIMNRRIECFVFRSAVASGARITRRGERWWRRAELADLPLSAVGLHIRRVLRDFRGIESTSVFCRQEHL